MKTKVLIAREDVKYYDIEYHGKNNKKTCHEVSGFHTEENDYIAKVEAIRKKKEKAATVGYFTYETDTQLLFRNELY